MSNTIKFTTKHSARQILLHKIEGFISKFTRKQDDLDESLVTRLSSVLKDFKSIGMYDPLPYEPNLFRILPLLFSEKKTISFPWFDDKKIEFLQIFNVNVDLIPHPEKKIRIPDPVLYQVNPEVILIPGIGFSPKKNRLGTGKGMYDRFLSQNKYKPVTIGCFYSCSMCEFPIDEHDMPLDIIITEKGFL